MKEFTANVVTGNGGSESVIVRASCAFEACAKLRRMGYAAINWIV